MYGGGDAREAEADLERALALAEPDGYVRVFLDEGQPMQILLAQWLSHQHVDGVSHEQVHGLAHAGSSPLRDYAIRLLSQFDAEPHTITTAQEKASPAGDLVEPLSERELEVLHLIAVGRTNQEIARQLGILP